MRTAFFDIDTQIDFVFPAGALYVPGAEQILPKIAELNRFAVSAKHVLLSTADAHSEDDPEFKIWKPHCVAGTIGQQKAALTLAGRAVTLSTEPGAFDRITDSLSEACQIVVEKQKLDCFTNPNLRPLLDFLRPERFVVYGVVTEYCVQCAALGLLQLGRSVELVTDGIKSLDPAAESRFFQRFSQQGGVLTTVASVTSQKHA